jgi:glycosyltransferase involved in cell wall biosynthesis
MSAAMPGRRLLPRTLAGATILQIVPDLSDDPIGRTALDVAQSLLHAGARAIVASEGGPLVVELKAFGGEWFAFAARSINPLQLRRNTAWLQDFAAAERVDVIHAQSVGAAWSALAATKRLPVWVVGSLPDVPKPPSRRHAFYLRALRRADQVVAPSAYVIDAMGARYGIARDKVAVIPRRVDTALFNPALVDPESVQAMRRSWRVRPGERVIIAPEPLAPGNGQLVLADAARMLLSGGWDAIQFVLMDGSGERRYARAVRNRAAAQGVDSVFRFARAGADMPTALAAADVAVVPALEAPVHGRAVAEAQAMARPVIAAQIGMLPEHLLAPPRMPERLRTGWTFKAGDAAELAHAIAAALSIDAEAYRTMTMRARQFAELTFSPASVAAATRAVYSSLLARDR